MSSDRPYTILSPTKVELGPDAIYWAKEHNLNLTQMARFLLAQEKLRQQENPSVSVDTVQLDAPIEDDNAADV